MKLAVATIYYNARLELERLYESLKLNEIDSPDYWFVGDGRFDLNESKSDYSNDGSREYIQSLKDKTKTEVITYDFIGTEHGKRNYYLDLCREYKIDALIIIDSDEYLHVIDWTKLRETIPKLNQKVNYQTVWSNFTKVTWGWYPRLWLRPYEIEYWNAHCLFKNRVTGIITQSTLVNNFEGFKDIIQIRGNDDLRTKEYLTNTFHYQEKMIQREKIFRKSVY